MTAKHYASVLKLYAYYLLYGIINIPNKLPS